MIYRICQYEVRVGATEPAHDHIDDRISSTAGEVVSGPHRSYRAAVAQLARAAKRHPFAWLAYAK